MIEELISYATGLGANAEVIGWLNNTGKKACATQKATTSDLEHIIDFLISNAAPPKLQKMSYADAKRKAKEWSERNQKKGKHLTDGPEDIEIIHDFLDGTKIVKLKTKKALEREGFLMSHCAGGYAVKDNHFIYSYRDAKNMPHATFEVLKDNNEITQIKGKGNGAIHPKYIHPILAFLKAIGMDIRPRDMINLGYYHVDASHLEFLRGYADAWKQVTMINGEAYAR